MLTPTDLAEWLASQEIEAELLENVGDTPTVPAAAAALAVSTDEIIKTLIFYVRGQPYSVISNGMAPVPTRTLAHHFGVGKRQIKLARAEQVVALTGYPVGGVPPFGHRSTSPVLLDRSVLAQPIVYGGGGDDHTMLRIESEELLRITEATVIDLS
ncbi:MAG: YbaK/EbsC family protein [Chloroflexi bacterium]|nr:YbaK/EbsC family protein [Chloroflexota bacterium]